MTRAIVVLLLATATLGVAPTAFAFHAGKTFAEAPGAGGGGGLYYVGSPRERGWTCTACHTEAPGRLKVRFSASLFRDFRYTADATTELTIRIENESLGLSSTLSNFNGMALSILDESGSPAGSFTNAAPEQYEIRSTSRGDLAIASAGQTTGVTEWRFSWIAPAAGAGKITMYLAVVDGNGANSAPDVTLSDPFGDDVYLAEVVLQEVTAAALVPARSMFDHVVVTRVEPGSVHARPRRRGRRLLRVRTRRGVGRRCKTAPTSSAATRLEAVGRAMRRGGVGV